MKHLLLSGVLLCVACATSVNAQTNYIDNYTTQPAMLTTIGTGNDGLNQPRDLDFIPNTNELWVVNRATNMGGEMVIYYNAGLPNQTDEWRKDSHSDHFLMYPTAIAMGDNGEMGGISEIQNTNSSSPTFMGPSLWLTDTSIFARVFQNDWMNGYPLGSHIDMLHQSPFGMGIAHDTLKAYWVFDGYNGNICKYDFVQDHGPGYDDHSAGKIWRYIDVPVTRVDNVPSHMVLDKATGWLYFIDGGSKTVKRLNTNTGAVTGNLTVPSTATEPLAGYYKVEGALVEVLDTLITQPCGIDFYNGRLVVSDYDNGNLYLYDIAGSTYFRDTVVTGHPGMMGVKVGPDGHIWVVNKTENKLYRIDAGVTTLDASIRSIDAPSVNNTVAVYYSTGFDVCSGTITPSITVANDGSTDITNLDLTYIVDGGSPVTFTWNGTLASQAVSSVALPSTSITTGSHLLSIRITSVNGATDDISSNNILDGAFRVINPPVTYPFTEGFTSTTFPPAGWQYVHYNKVDFMKRATVGGFGNGSGSLKMDNFSGNVDITGQKDYFISPAIDMSSAAATAGLRFSVAYAQYNANSVDQLQVSASTDCGDTWSVIYDKAGTTLSTASIATSAWTPTASDWRSETIGLSSYAGNPNVILMFTTISNWGNNVYVDDIQMDNVTGVKDLVANETFTVYPNPASDELHLAINATSNQSCNLSVIDLLGRKHYNVLVQLQSGSNLLDLSPSLTQLTSGAYIVELSSANGIQIQKVNVNR